MWDVRTLVEAAVEGLKREERRLRREQAVYGLDALSEVDLHPLVWAGFRRARLGVCAEQPYPGELGGSGGRRRKNRERERCDVVLTPGRAVKLADPMDLLVEQARAAGTLFEKQAKKLKKAAEMVGPEEAFWVEIKAVGQFTFSNGVPVGNRTYTSELLQGAAADLAKLGKDSSIYQGALLLILFTVDQETARHDVAAFVDRCLSRTLLAEVPVVSSFPMVDRIGNGVCTVGMFRARRSG